MYGKIIKKIRMSKNLTQGTFAKLLNTTPTSVCLWEKNKVQVPFKKILEISNTFGVNFFIKKGVLKIK